MIKKILELIKATAKDWWKHNPIFIGAGISFYILLSLGPIFTLLIFLIDALLGQGEAKEQILNELQKIAGEKPAQFINGIISKASTSGSKLNTIIASIPLMFFGSTMVFIQLRYALNVVWEIEDKNGQKNNKARSFIFSFLMLFFLGILLLILVLKTPVFYLLKDFLQETITISPFLFRIFDAIITFIVLYILFYLVYSVLAQAKMRSEHIRIGALATTILFSLMQFLIFLNVRNTQIDSAYGAIGYFTVLLLWIFYSSLAFLFGASFTKVYSQRQKSLN